jgi:putative effector of murein hydrolase LrgA (UPF0299 family)
VLKRALIWGVIGVGVAVLFTLLSSLLELLHPSPALDVLRQDIELFVWPTSFWLMATEGAGRATAIEIVVMAVLGNFLVYFLVGLLLTSLWRVGRRLVARRGAA